MRRMDDREERVGVRLRQDELQKLERLAETQDRTKSDVLRHLIRQAEDPEPVQAKAKQ